MSKEPIKCKQCGHCCRHTIIEINQLDVLREPKILEHAQLLDGKGKIEFESDAEKEYILACGASMPHRHHSKTVCSRSAENVCWRQANSGNAVYFNK